jgi:hypothetical protein
MIRGPLIAPFRSLFAKKARKGLMSICERLP